MKKILILNLVALYLIGFQLKADEQVVNAQNHDLRLQTSNHVKFDNQCNSKIARFKAKRDKRDISKIEKAVPKVESKVALKKSFSMKLVLIGLGGVTAVALIPASQYICCFCYCVYYVARTIIEQLW